MSTVQNTQPMTNDIICFTIPQTHLESIIKELSALGVEIEAKEIAETNLSVLKKTKVRFKY